MSPKSSIAIFAAAFGFILGLIILVFIEQRQHTNLAELPNSRITTMGPTDSSYSDEPSDPGKTVVNAAISCLLSSDEKTCLKLLTSTNQWQEHDLIIKSFLKHLDENSYFQVVHESGTPPTRKPRAEEASSESVLLSRFAFACKVCALFKSKWREGDNLSVLATKYRRKCTAEISKQAPTSEEMLTQALGAIQIADRQNPQFQIHENTVWGSSYSWIVKILIPLLTGSFFTIGSKLFMTVSDEVCKSVAVVLANHFKTAPPSKLQLEGQASVSSSTFTA